MPDDAIFNRTIVIETDNFQLYLERELAEGSFSQTIQFQSEEFVFFYTGELADGTATGSVRIATEENQIDKSWEVDLEDVPRNDDPRIAFVEDYSLIDIL